jgi:hypothetical protein
MNAKYREAPLARRVMAKIADFFLVPTVVGIIPINVNLLPRVPALICVLLLMYLYLLLADGWKGQSVGNRWAIGGQSVGKRLFGLKVVNYQTGSPCTFFESFVRNVAFFGIVRIWQIAEEESSIGTSNYKGTIVIDVQEPKTPLASEAPPKPAKLDLEGIADFARRKKDPDR